MGRMQLHLQRQQFQVWAKNNWVPIWLGIISFTGIGLVAIFHGKVMSLFDEWGYLDYLYKIPIQGMVLKGEFYSHQAMNLMACHGEIPFGVMGGACGTYDPATFPNDGVVTADPYTPLYFYSIWIAGLFFSWIPVLDPVNSWRLANVLWLVAGLVIFYRLALAWRVPKGIIFSVGLLIIGSPFSYWAFSYVSTDAPSLFFGLLLLLLATKYSRGELKGFWLVIVSVLATLFKATNIIAVCSMVLFLLLDLIFVKQADLGKNFKNKKQKFAKYLLLASLSLGISALAEILWLKLNLLLAATNLSVDQGVTSPLTWFEVLRLSSLTTQTLNMTVGVNGLPGLSGLPLPDYAVLPLSWILIAGVLSALWGMKPHAIEKPYVVMIFIMTFIAGPLLAVTLNVITGTYFVLPPRYMAPVIGIAMISVAISIKNKTVARVLAGVGIAYILALIAASFTISQVSLGA